MRSGFILSLLVTAALLAGCLAPSGGPPPAPTMPTTMESISTTAQLKYILLDHYGENRFA